MARAELDWSTLKLVVAQALELPVSRRRAHLDAAPMDTALRARAVRLLEACLRAEESALFQAPGPAFADELLQEVDSGESLAIDRLREALEGRYVIEREVGRGGMATVYLGRDVRHGRDVALKVLRWDRVGDDGHDRFQREIGIAASLSHPHILPLYDSGVIGDLLFYVTPFADGESLADRLRRTGPPPLGETLRLLRDVARGLSYAHRRGLLHLDVKPANILLTEEGDPLIADFGVARVLGGPAPWDPALDAADLGGSTQVMGTPAYMAPEQIVGSPDIDRQADLYALGVVAYELLTGAAPFHGKAPREQLQAHLSTPPEPLALRRPDVPSALAELVDRLLAKRPDERPGEAEIHEVVDALVGHSVPGDGALRSVRDTPTRRGTRDGEAHQLFQKGLHLLAVRQRDAMWGALRYFEEATRRDPHFARAFAGMADAWVYLSIFGHAPPPEACAKARAAAERSVELDPALVQGRATLAHIRFVYDWEWATAEAALRRGMALDPTYAPLRLYHASFLHSVGRSDEALAQLQVARELDPVGRTGLLRGRILVDTERPEEAIAVLREEVELDPRQDLAHQCLAHAYLQKGMDEEAVASMRRAANLSGPRDTAQLVYVLARTGSGAPARKVLRDLMASGPPSGIGFHVAMAYAGLGEEEEAFRWLESAYEEHAGFMNLLGVATGFESIRADPRFAELLTRMGLHPSRAD